MFKALSALIFVAIGLSGCVAGVRVVDAQVQTTAARAPGAGILAAGARYHLEPAVGGVGQLPPARIDAMAEAALARVGLVRDDAVARLGVQASANVNAYWAYGYEPSNAALSLGLGRGFRGGGVGFGFGFGGPIMDPTIPAYVSEARLLMRDVQTGQIVYDSRARHDGPWHDTENVIAALFAASLQGFPVVPDMPRRVQVPLLPVEEGSARPTAPAAAAAAPATVR